MGGARRAEAVGGEASPNASSDSAWCSAMASAVAVRLRAWRGAPTGLSEAWVAGVLVTRAAVMSFEIESGGALAGSVRPGSPRPSGLVSKHWRLAAGDCPRVGRVCCGPSAGCVPSAVALPAVSVRDGGVGAGDAFRCLEPDKMGANSCAGVGLVSTFTVTS